MPEFATQFKDGDGNEIMEEPKSEDDEEFVEDENDD